MFINAALKDLSELEWPKCECEVEELGLRLNFGLNYEEERDMGGGGGGVTMAVTYPQVNRPFPIFLWSLAARHPKIKDTDRRISDWPLHKCASVSGRAA